MDLSSYIRSYPRHQRSHIRTMLARGHGVSEVTVRAWANGTRRHPCTLAAVKITEQYTQGRVTRFDVRPDIFGSGKTAVARQSHTRFSR